MTFEEGIIMVRKINRETDVPNIIKMRNNGISIKEIADTYHVSSSRIGQILRDNGVRTPNSRYLQFTYEEVKRMYNDYTSGVSRKKYRKRI